MSERVCVPAVLESAVLERYFVGEFEKYDFSAARDGSRLVA
jgi:hypothetical protein